MSQVTLEQLNKEYDEAKLEYTNYIASMILLVDCEHVQELKGLLHRKMKRYRRRLEKLRKRAIEKRLEEHF